jgi:hypothetical protein
MGHDSSRRLEFEKPIHIARSFSGNHLPWSLQPQRNTEDNVTSEIVECLAGWRKESEFERGDGRYAHRLIAGKRSELDQ